MEVESRRKKQEIVYCYSLMINVLTSTQRTKKESPNDPHYSFQFNPLIIQMILELFVNMESLLQSNINSVFPIMMVNNHDIYSSIFCTFA